MRAEYLGANSCFTVLCRPNEPLLFKATQKAYAKPGITGFRAEFQLNYSMYILTATRQ
jgi:hypothetical protein